MLAAITVVEESGIMPDGLARELPSLPPHERLRLEVFLRYYRAFGKELQDARALDAPALFQHLRHRMTPEELASAFRLAFPHVREVRIEGFDDFAGPEIAFVERLKSVPDVDLSISLGFHSENPRVFGYIEQHARVFQAMGFVPARESQAMKSLATLLAPRLFNRQTDEGRIDVSSQVAVVEARTRWHELTAICRLIKRIAAEKPEKDLSTICVAMPRPEMYTEIVRERFGAYGIPVNVTDRFELSRSPLVMDIVGLLEIRGNDFQRDAVLRVLHSPFLSLGATEGLGVNPGNLVDVSRRLRVTSGFQLWLRKIDAEIRSREARQRAVKDSAGESDNDSFLQALRKARADILRIEDLTHGLDGEMTPGEFESMVVALLGRLKLPERLAASEAAGETEERDARAYARFLDILRDTVRILESRSGMSRHGLGYYLDRLTSAISGERYNVPERQGVLVTDLGETRGMPVAVMILAGMEDSSIPGPAEPELFLSGAMQHAREQRRVQRSRYLFYIAATNWTERLYITYPLRDAGVDLVRSSFLDAFLAVASVQHLDDRSPSVAGGALFSEEEFLAWDAGRVMVKQEEEDAVPRNLRERGRRVRQGRRIEWSRSMTHVLGEYEGMIGGALSPRASSSLRKLGAAPFSVSDLETYGECPFKFFAGSLLGLRAPAEYMDEVSSQERGYIVHDVLFEFYRERQARNLPPIRHLTDEAFDDAVREITEIAERRLSRVDIPGPFWDLEKESILGSSGHEAGLLRMFLMAERQRTDQMQPAFFEVAFGQPGHRPGDMDPRLSTPATIKVGDVNLRGRVDRVDVGEDCFTVTDYKTGSLLPTLAEIRSGASLQLPLYLRAVENLL
ncbi:hypothetical protein EHM92_06605, partial [bacterium]